MKILIVKAFYDLGRAKWDISPRSKDDYIKFATEYVKRMSPPKYILTDELGAISDGFDHKDIAGFGELEAHKYLQESRRTLSSTSFSELTKTAKVDRIEYHHAEYNIVGLAKWDAIERAFLRTSGSFTHYLWLDYGLGRRGGAAPFLPSLTQVTPCARRKIVLSAKKTERLTDIKPEELRMRVVEGRFACAGGMQLVPAELVSKYCSLARSSYKKLLELGLCVNDQVILDVMSVTNSDMFHLATPPKYFDVFENIDRVLRGVDGPLNLTRAPLIKKIAAKAAKEDFFRRM